MEWLSSVGPGLGNHLWQSTAFGCFVWGLTLALRKNRGRVRYGLWLAASVKFLIPFSVLIGLGGMLPRPHSAAVVMPVYSVADEIGMPFVGMPVNTADAGLRSPLRKQFGKALPATLLVIWSCGVMLVLALWNVRWRQVAGTLRRATRAEDGREWETLRRVEEKMGAHGRIVLMTSQELMEPGIFGVWRPTLIWPKRLTTRLEDEHIEAIVAHELIHARRRDNLTAALHMVVESVFWFHPMVWWIERRMVEERERACDEAVVETGSTPGIYAESLLKTMRFCVESPLVCLAGVTGADLNQRVRMIMTLRLERLVWSRKVALAGFALVTVMGPVGFGVLRMVPMYGQALTSTAMPPSFQVATIKASSKEDSRAAMGFTAGGRGFYTINATARDLVQEAYGLKSTDQIQGASGWMTTEHFDVEARMEDGQADRLKAMPMGEKIEQVRLMVQSLLRERFELKVHESTRESTFFELETMKGGAKLKSTAMAPADPDGVKVPHPAVGPIVHWNGPGKLQATGVGLGVLTEQLSRMPELGFQGGFTMGILVVDKTELTGMYDWTLNWSPENASGERTENADAPPLFTALQEQLGLKLVKAKGPVELVVIDHLDRPSAN